MGCCGLIKSKKKASEEHELPARPVNATAEQKRARELEAQLEAESKKNADLLQQRGRPLSLLPRSLSLPAPSNLNPSSPAPTPQKPTVGDDLPALAAATIGIFIISRTKPPEPLTFETSSSRESAFSYKSNWIGSTRQES